MKRAKRTKLLFRITILAIALGLGALLTESDSQAQGPGFSGGNRPPTGFPNGMNGMPAPNQPLVPPGGFPAPNQPGLPSNGMMGNNRPGMPGGFNGANQPGNPGGFNGANQPGMPGGMNGMNQPGMPGGMNGMNGMNQPGMPGGMNGMNGMNQPGMPGGMNGNNRFGMPNSINGVNQPNGMAGFNQPPITPPMGFAGGNQQIPQDSWICEKCGKVVATGAKPENMANCPYCGVSLNNTEAGRKKRNWSSLISIVVVGVVVLVSVLIRKGQGR